MPISFSQVSANSGQCVIGASVRRTRRFKFFVRFIRVISSLISTNDSALALFDELNHFGDFFRLG